MELKRCPICHSSKIERAKKELRYRLGNKVHRIPDITREICKSCGEEFFSREANKKIDSHLFGKLTRVA